MQSSHDLPCAHTVYLEPHLCSYAFAGFGLLERSASHHNLCTCVPYTRCVSSMKHRSIARLSTHGYWMQQCKLNINGHPDEAGQEMQSLDD